MPKPTKFKYKRGQSVKFRFYDGSIHVVIIKPLKDYPTEETHTKLTPILTGDTKSTEPSLDQAIEKQRQFLNR